MPRPRLLACLASAAVVAVACTGGPGRIPAPGVATPVGRPATLPPSGGGLVLAAVDRSADQPFYIDLQQSFVDAAIALGAEARTFDAQLDPNLAVSLVNDAISLGARGIAIAVPDQSIGPAVARAAREAGVVLVATEVSIVDESGSPVPFVGHDGREMGTQVGEAAAGLLADSGWLDDSRKKVGVLSVEVQTLAACNERTDSAKAALVAAGVPESQVLAVPYTGEIASARDATGPIVMANPVITDWVVVGCNDEGVLGALDFLDEAGVDPGRIIGVGLGAHEACRAWATGEPTGFKAALFASGLDVGAMAAEVLYGAVSGGSPPPAASYAPTVIVGPNTYRDLLDATSLESCSG